LGDLTQTNEIFLHGRLHQLNRSRHRSFN